MSFISNKQSNLKRKCEENLDLSDLYSFYDSERNTLSELKHQIIKLEDELRKEREVKQSFSRKINTLEQELELIKVKRIIHPMDQGNVTNHKIDASEIENIEKSYYRTEEQDRTINDLKIMLNDANRVKEEVTEKYALAESEIENYKAKFEDYTKLKDELHKYIAENQEKLNKYSQLQQKIEELENTLSDNQTKDPIRDYPMKMLNLQSKCLILEKENEKLKKQSCNIGVLLEENKSLQIQLDSLKKSHDEIEALDQSQNSNKSLTEDQINKEDRRKRCLEKEIEILKSQSTKDSELIQELTETNSFLTEENEGIKSILEKQSLLCQEKEASLRICNLQIQRYQKEGECYKKLLSQFSDISMLTGDCSQILASLNDLYDELESSINQCQQQYSVLSDLSELLSSQIEHEEFSLHSNKNSQHNNNTRSRHNDQTIMLQLREEILELTQKLAESTNKNEQYAKLEENSQNKTDVCIQAEINDGALSDDQLKELGFKEGQINPGNTQLAKSMLFYRKFNKIWRQALQQIIGYRVELTNENLLTIQPIANQEKQWIFEFELQLTEGAGDEPQNLIKSVNIIENQILMNETNWLNRCNQSENREFLIPKFFAQLLLDKIDQLDIKNDATSSEVKPVEPAEVTEDTYKETLLKDDSCSSDPENDVVHSSEEENMDYFSSQDEIGCDDLEMDTVCEQDENLEELGQEPTNSSEINCTMESSEIEITNKSEIEDDVNEYANDEDEEIYDSYDEEVEDDSEIESDAGDERPIYESSTDDEQYYENGYEDIGAAGSNLPARGFVEGEVVNISDSDDDE